MTACRHSGARRLAVALGVALLATATGIAIEGGAAASARQLRTLPGANALAQDPVDLCIEGGLTDRGAIVGALSLPPGTYHVIECSLTVEAGASLTIPAGVTIIFGEGEGLSVDGTLSVEGASAGDVVFTSDRPVKSPGDWDGIQIDAEPGSAATIRGATIEYAQDGIVSHAANTTVESSRIADMSRLGINFVGIDGAVRGVVIERTAGAGMELEQLRDGLVTVEVSNSTITNTGAPGAILAGANVQVNVSGNTASDNAMNAIVIETGNVEQPITWRAGDFPLYLHRGVGVRAELTIEPGTVVKVGSSGDIAVGELGRLNASGTSEANILFTSIADDACSSDGIECDTNNDGPGTPSPGAWNGLSFAASSGGGALEFAEVRLADDAVEVLVEGVAVRDSKITRSAGHAILVDDVTTEIVRNHLVDNAENGVHATADDNSITLTVQDNVFEDNAAAVAADGDIEIENSGNTTPGFSNSRNGYVITGSFEQPHTWRAGDLPFIPTGVLRVSDAASVITLEPDLIVKFDEDARIINESGRLVIGASGDAPVLLTSVQDDACSVEESSGCDTNGDGGDTAPARGSWGNIVTQAGSRGLFVRNVIFRYAGTLRSNQPTLRIENDASEIIDSTISLGKSAGIDVFKAAPQIRGNTIEDNEGAGIKISGDGSPLTVALTDNTIRDNGQNLPLSASVGAIEIDANVELDLDDSNVAESPSSTSRQLNGIVVSGVVRNSLRWRASNLPYVLISSVDVQLEKRLTLDPGIVLKFGRSGRLRTTRGTLSAVGTAEAPIRFTSLADARPEAGGSTDGALGSPSAGDWGGIEINAANVCEADTGVCARLEHIEVRYAGQTNQAAIKVEQPATLIADAYIADALDAGVFAEDASGTTVRDSTIERVQGVGIVADLRSAESAEMTMQGNTISACGAGIRIDANVQPRLGLDADDTGNEITGCRINGIVVEGSLDRIRRWPAGDEIYVMTGDVEIDTGSLTLAPGVVIKADLEAELIIERGAITAEYDQSVGGVVFTSLRQDVCGEVGAGTCDTNGDGETTEADLGDWEGITIRSTATSGIIDNMTMHYAGRNRAALVVERSNTAVRGSEIRYSLTDGVLIDSAAGIVFADNLVADNLGNGLVLGNDVSGRIEGNVFTGNGRSIHHRSRGRIDSLGNIAIGNVADPMLYCADVNESQRWSSDLAREVGCRIRVLRNSSLEIDPGSLIRFAEGTAVEVESNTLRAKGVVFSSVENGMIPGFWRGIIFENGASGFIQHSLLAYGGGSDGIVHIETGGVEVTNNTLLRNLSTGVSLENDVSATISGNVVRSTFGRDAVAIRMREDGNSVVTHNRIDDVDIGIDTDDHLPRIQFNNFSGVRTFGVNNRERANCVDARWNWWGNASGPRDRSEGRDDRCRTVVNLDGTGVPSSDYVGYEPWLTVGPPAVPMVDLPRCGFTNDGDQTVLGRAASGAQVRVYDGTREIATGTADTSGRFSIPVELEDGDHELSVETFAAAGGAPEELRSARTGFRLVSVDSGQAIDPASITFRYGPSGSQRAQPLRTETGCAAACGGPSAGRVMLPESGTVVVTLRAQGSPSSIAFVQPDRAPVPFSSGGDGTWTTAPFDPQAGTFSLEVDGGDAGFCDGYVFRGGRGRVFSDEGAPGAPAATWGFETGSEGWSLQPNWARTDRNSFDGRYSVTDSPDGNTFRDNLTAMTLSAPVDMRVTVAPVLRFWHWRRIGPGDEARVEAKICFECEWEELAAWDDVVPTWQYVEVPLEQYARRPELYIRFVVETDDEGEDDGWYLDNIEIGNGGMLNGRYDEGEPLLEDAQITLHQRNPDTGEFSRWDPNPTGQRNPQSTDAEGRYGFYGLPNGEYRVLVENVDGMEPLYTEPIVVMTGAFDVDLALRRASPIFLPYIQKGRR